MFQKLEAVEKRYEELTKLISDPEIIANHNEWQKYVKEHAQSGDIVLTLGAGTVTNIGPMLVD